MAGKLLLVLAVIMACMTYFREHTNVQVREWQTGELLPGVKEEVYGIGFGPEDGSLFWFHKRTELQVGKEESGKES